MSDRATAAIHFDFPHAWQARILPAPPMIAPARSFLYPQSVEGEEEALARGALLVQIRPEVGREFLATCALGFAEDGPLNGVWSCPNPSELCAVAGGYAYILDTTAPPQCVQVEQRPVIEVLASLEAGVLLFVGFHSIAAWGADGLAWQTPRITWEGLRITALTATEIAGMAWDMPTDAEVPFAVALQTGAVTGGAFPRK